MRSLYNTAIQDANNEAAALRKALGKIAEIRGIKNEIRLQIKNGGIHIGIAYPHYQKDITCVRVSIFGLTL